MEEKSTRALPQVRHRPRVMVRQAENGFLVLHYKTGLIEGSPDEYVADNPEAALDRVRELVEKWTS